MREKYIGEDVENLELVYISGGNVKWYSFSGKWFGDSSKLSCTLWPRWILNPLSEARGLTQILTDTIVRFLTH